VAKKFGQVLRAARWTPVRQAGSQETWEDAGARRAITIAGKGSNRVPVGTLAAIQRAMKHYLVIYEQAEDGAWEAHSPDVEGVFALGSSRRMAEALAAHLDYLRKTGRPVPDPHTDAGRLAA
jgi:predicted RNase H-like HicB family nuclease/predicted RNA binding protein YcfA (HicA-like mRNA interferase family)